MTTARTSARAPKKLHKALSKRSSCYTIEYYPTKMVRDAIKVKNTIDLNASQIRLPDLRTSDADTQDSPVVRLRIAPCNESAMSSANDQEADMEDAEIFFGQVYGLLDLGRKDEATDLVYDVFHDLLTKGDYDQCSALFLVADPSRLGSSLSRTLLMLTAKRKMSIWSRARFSRSALAYITATQDGTRAQRLLGHLI